MHDEFSSADLAAAELAMRKQNRGRDMAAERCETCRFWERFRSVIGDGTCHAHPPQINTAKIAASTKAHVEACRSGSWQMPSVHGTNWCGEWQAMLPVRKKKK